MSSFRSPSPSSSGFWSIERVVALLTPVFSAAAGWLTTVVGKAVPGLAIPKGDLTALFIAGSVTALSAALMWLRGRQKFVSVTTDAERIVQEVVKQIGQAGGAPLADVERILAAHEQNIIGALGNAVGAPPSVEHLAEEIIKQLFERGASPPAGAVAGQAAGGQVAS